METYDTGPFCRHWSDPVDCDIECGVCGHRCYKHDIEEDVCFVPDCTCPAWEEDDE
jgi:hypothetical protein